MCNKTFMDNKTQLNIINTNARSLRPKLSSFINCFMNLTLALAIVSETWLANGSGLEREAENLLLGHGLRLTSLNRNPHQSSGVAYGGVAVITRDAISKVSEYKIDNPLGFEVLPLCVTIKNVRRKLYVVAAYIPPNYTVPRGRDCLQHISDIILDIKRRHDDPLILVAGDFNQWEVGEALADYDDLEEIITPATRGTRRIDRVFMNWTEDVEDSGCLPPLETNNPDGNNTKSDHLIQYVVSRIPTVEQARVEHFKYRPFTVKGADDFKAEILTKDWADVIAARDSNQKAAALDWILMDMMNRHFPEVVTRRKDTDLLWLDNKARRMIKKKQAIYKAEGASDRWNRILCKLEEHLDARKQLFLAKQRQNFIGPQANTDFFRNIKNFSSAEKPKSFDVRSLRPGVSDAEVAKEVAEYFNRISQEFRPLETNEIPTTYDREVTKMTEEEVEKKLKTAKKPKSMVQGDVFPVLVTECAGSIAVPLTDIFNSILETFVWPISWKREYVTVIPKKNIPESLSDLRNISCTQLFSKVFEGVVLARLQEEVSLKKNQYGGVRGCSTTHMIVDIIQEICENAEDYRAATILTAIDYSKAFNRVSYQHCLEAFRKKGASTQTLRLLATFLTNRTMSVRVGQTWSEPLGVNGGCPQGSVLGVFLFNGTTDSLEDNFLAHERARLHLPENQAAPTVERPAPPPPPAGIAASSPARGDTAPPACHLSPIEAGAFAPGRDDTPYTPALSTLPRQPVLLTPPREERVGPQVLEEKRVKFFKYVDDNIICVKLNYGSTPITVTSQGVRVKIKQSIPSQNAFRSVTGSAEAIGMLVNTSKTNLICISDALNYTPQVYIEGPGGELIQGGQTLKVLGFHFSTRPGVSLHVEQTVKKIRQRHWILTHLSKVGFNEEELVAVYKSVVLPVADYCCPAYHSLLTDIQDQLLERAQVGALRRIFGYGLSARRLRDKAGVQTLRSRRIELTDKFARKAAASSRFCHWFPKNIVRRNTRNPETYKEFFAKCDRLKNSPLFYMRRRLNGKEGKVYGERNRIYRENLNAQN